MEPVIIQMNQFTIQHIQRILSALWAIVNHIFRIIYRISFIFCHNHGTLAIKQEGFVGNPLYLQYIFTCAITQENIISIWPFIQQCATGNFNSWLIKIEIINHIPSSPHTITHRIIAGTKFNRIVSIISLYGKIWRNCGSINSKYHLWTIRIIVKIYRTLKTIGHIHNAPIITIGYIAVISIIRICINRIEYSCCIIIIQHFICTILQGNFCVANS